MNVAVFIRRCATISIVAVLLPLTACEQQQGTARSGGAEPETPKQIYNVIDALDAQLQEDPNAVNAYVRRGNAKVAVADFEGGETVTILYQEAWSDFKTAHELAGGAWDFPDVLEETRRASQSPTYRLDLRPMWREEKAGSAAALCGAARLCSRVFNAELGIMLLRRAAALAPDDPHVQAERIAAEGYARGDLPGAVKEIDALRGNAALKNDADYWETLGALHWVAGDAAGAEAGLRHCLSIAPGRMAATALLREVLVGQGKAEEAKQIRALRDTLNRNPVLAVNNYAAQFLGGRQYAQALQLCERITEKYPEFPLAWVNLGDCYLGLRQYDAALHAAQTAAERLPDGPAPRILQRNIYGSRALGALMAGDSAAAADDFAQASALGQLEAPMLAYRWIALQDTARGADADACVKAAPPPVSDDPYDRLVSMLAGKLTPEELLANAPDHERECEACFFIGELHRARGDMTTACSWYHKTVAFGLTDFVEHVLAQRRLKDCPPG